MTDLVGRTLSHRYRLVSRLSGGHLGDVYSAEDQRLGRPVAVKVLPHAFAVDEATVERFRSEASAVSRLTHPNTIAVYDWGADAGTFYMVMERVPSTDVRDLLVARGALAPAQAADLIAQTCDALGAAHRAGLVHRALKPENILITEDGVVKVADFALSAVAPREDLSSSGMSTSLRYIAPEQALGFEASATSDIWAAGAVLSEILTARPPLQGAGADLIERRAHEEPIPPSRWDRSIPPDLDEIVLKACALDPARRFYDATDMSHALRRAAARSLPAAPPLQDLVGNISPAVDDEVVEPNPFVKEAASGRHAKPKLKLRIGRILLMTVLLTLLVAGAIFGGRHLLVPKQVAVPDVAELTVDAARDRVEASGLELTVAERKRDIEVGKGKIISQSPEDGDLTEGESLEVVVSLGLPQIMVPSVEGKSGSVARERLKEKNFEIGRVLRRYSMKENKRVVLKQLPAKGKHSYGSEVHLVISKGPPPVKVPNVVGTLTVAALKELEREGLKPEQSDAYSDTVDAGLVISTRPAAGKTLHRGDKIEVVNSLGPEFEEVSVPDVRGWKVNAASAELSNAGLNVEIVDSCKKNNKVVDTDPGAGTVVREADTVTILAC